MALQIEAYSSRERTRCSVIEEMHKNEKDQIKKESVSTCFMERVTRLYRVRN